MSMLCFSLTSPSRRPALTTCDRSVPGTDLDAVRGPGRRPVPAGPAWTQPSEQAAASGPA